MRRMLLLVLILALAVGGAATGVVAVGDEPVSPEVLPDLEQAAPQGITVTSAEGRYRLTFLSAAENAGPGSLLIEGERLPDAGTMAATQVVLRADGSRAEYALPTELRYVRSETHQHWHLLRFESYELRRPDDGSLVAPDEKTGFCLGDRYDAERLEPPEEPPRPVWVGECARDRPGATELRQGISPGYGDDYVPNLEGQWVDVTDVPPGRYVLVHRVNPDGILREETTANNASSALVALRRDGEGRPLVRVLATCPDSAECS